MDPQNTKSSAWVTVGKTTYPNGGEPAATAMDRLTTDIQLKTGTALGANDRLRLHDMVVVRFPARYYPSHGKLLEQLATYVVSLDATEAPDYLEKTSGFRRGNILLRSGPNLTDLGRELAAYPDFLAVVTGTDHRDVAAAGLASRVVVLGRGSATRDVCVGLMARLSRMRINVVDVPPGPGLYQVPQERGDMHDVRPLLALDKNLRVIVCVQYYDTWGDAAEILNYYLEYGNRVSVYLGRAPDRDKRNGILRVTDATRLLLDAALEGKALPALTSTCGSQSITEQERDAFVKDLTSHGWGDPKKVPKPLMIVNFRDSGHMGSLVRERSHPELDTGTEGFVQLLTLVRDMGFIPVPMGHRDDLVPTDVKGPGLLEYWRWASCAEVPGQPRRLREYRLLRFIATAFQGKVFALAMRSGSTDALCYSGIPTISIDLALEGCNRDEVLANGLVELNQQKELVFPFGHPGSWRRAMKRLLIVPKVFHQVFLSKIRDERATSGKNWKGTFDAADLTAIQEAVMLYFLKNEHIAPPPNSPLKDAENFAKNCLLFYDPAYAKALADTKSKDGFERVQSRQEIQDRRTANRAVLEAREDLDLLIALMRKNSDWLT